MTKLIDVDNIEIVQIARGNGKTLFAEMFKKIINAAPTVEAIPIKWIEQYGKNNWFDYGTQHNAITCMLKAWKEENEE